MKFVFADSDIYSQIRIISSEAMKRKQLQELKNKPPAELRHDLINYRNKLRELKFNLAQGKVKNIREIKATKKMIARILTIINKISE